ncbi:MAG: DUF5996 family protein [Pseudomonadota bacterium]
MAEDWPDIPHAPWAETCTALHLMCQIVGKVRLAHAPWVNHSWHATLYITPRGLTTGPIHHPRGCLTLSFDLHAHRLVAENAGGWQGHFALEPMSTADFLDRTAALVAEAGADFEIHGAPNELPEATPFAADTARRPYDGAAVARYHRALLHVDRVFSTFRTGFLGKVSPVHLFWGSFDVAVTRFSGRSAPTHPGGIPNLPDSVTQEAYSHEVSSSGFWPGNGGAGAPMFYSYTYPTADSFKEQPVEPDAAYWDDTLGEFLLPYEAVRTAPDPSGALLAFLRSTYAAAEKAAGWDPALDCDIQQPRVPRDITAG